MEIGIDSFAAATLSEDKGRTIHSNIALAEVGKTAVPRHNCSSPATNYDLHKDQRGNCGTSN